MGAGDTPGVDEKPVSSTACQHVAAYMSDAAKIPPVDEALSHGLGGDTDAIPINKSKPRHPP